jgi:hypothetical protein
MPCGEPPPARRPEAVVVTDSIPVGVGRLAHIEGEGVIDVGYPIVVVVGVCVVTGSIAIGVGGLSYRPSQWPTPI